MRRLIPDFIVERHRDNRLSGSLQAQVINVDIKGITALTQALMSHSHAGVETLTDTINNLFTPAILAIEGQGGFVSGFAGDAFTAVFPDPIPTEIKGRTSPEPYRVQCAALKIRDSVVAQGRQNTEFGEYILEVRIGVGCGEVQWKILETDSQAVYYFCGTGIQKAVQAQELAQTNEVIADKEFCAGLDASSFSWHDRGDGYCRIELSDRHCEPIENPRPFLSEQAFVPDSVLQLGSEGEFRNLLSCFINLSNPISDQVFAIVSAAARFGGYLSHIDCTDKGWVAYFMFGAPLGFEKLELRALEFTLEVQNLCGRNARIGLTEGQAFAGFIGSHSRSEYTGMGRAVNLAARFMTQAAWGEIWFDDTIRTALASSIASESLGELLFKGYPQPIPAYRLLSKLQDNPHAFFQSEFRGRETELSRLVASCNPLFDARNAGVAYIYGEAGQGKSRLVYELERHLADKLQCFELQTDSIHRSSLNPFAYWINQQFAPIQTANLVERRKVFRSAWADFLAKLKLQPDSEKICIELARVESILAGLIGLDWEGSIYTSLDSKYRPTATGFALRTLLEAHCLLKPVLLVIEDLHWLDKESEEVISILTHRAGNLPFKLILTARPFDDGRHPALNLDREISVESIFLDGLSLSHAQGVIDGLLSMGSAKPQNLRASSELTQYIHGIAQGNPFIIEQLTRYLREAQQLKIQDNTFCLITQNSALPSGVQAILIARLDRLETELKHTVQTASVLGREFAVDILGEMLETLENRPENLNDIVVRSQLYAGEQEHIWNSLSEIKYIFSHSLLREAAYAMQLKKQIMQLHDLAARTMEKHYANDGTRLSEIAAHYLNAGDTHKAASYYEQCAKHEQRKGNCLESVKWARRSLELEPGSHSALVQLITSLDFADQRIEARELAKKRLAELEKAGLGKDRQAYDMLRLIVLTCNSEFETQEMEPWTFKLYERTKELFPERSFEMFHVYNSLGSLYMNKQMYEESEKYYRKVLAICENCIGEARHEANTTLNDLGLLYCHLQRYEEALPLLESAINAHNEEFGEGHPGSIYTLINYCSALFRSGQHEAALERYLKTKELVLKTVGTDHDKYFKVMQHLSGIYTELERYQEAEACLRENLELQISRKDDSTFEVAVLLRGLAGVLNRTGDPAEAEECARRAVEIFRIVAAEESFQAIVARKVFAHVLFNRGKYAEALAELLDLIELTQKIGSDPFELMIFYQNVVVEIYSRQERWEDAEKFLANVLSRYREKGTESPAYAEYQTKYAEVLKKLGKLT